jgi:hypothetical protein
MGATLLSQKTGMSFRQAREFIQVRPAAHVYDEYFRRV